MESNKTTVRRLMDESVFKGQKFAESHKQQVLNRISKKERNNKWIPRSLNVVFSLILLVSVVYLLSNLTGVNDSPMQQGSPDSPHLPQEPTNSAVPPSTENADSNEKPVDDGEKQEEDSISEDTLFELSSEEQKAYERFKEDFNTVHLKDLEPISVAKLYVHASFDQNFEVQYELMTDRQESVMWDKEHDAAIPLEDRPSPEEVITLFNNFEEGEFIEIEEHTGFIRFNRTENPEGVSGFQMIQNEDGIWQVAFMPLQ